MGSQCWNGLTLLPTWITCIPSCTSALSQAREYGILWHEEHTCLWNGITIPLSIIFTSSTLFSGRCVALAWISKMELTKTWGLLGDPSISSRRIISRKVGMSWGLGYNSMSDGKTKWVCAISRATLRATLMGYVRLLLFLYVLKSSPYPRKVLQSAFLKQGC